MRRVKKFIEVQANLVWNAHRDPKSGVWIGICEPLNLNAIGDTFAQMQECANEAMTLLFADLFEENELDAFLKQHGWRVDPTPTPGGQVPQFDIPVDWRRQGQFSDMAAQQA